MTTITSAADALQQLWALTGDDDPYPVYARVREAGRLLEVEPGFFLASGHVEVKAVLGSRDALVRNPENAVQEEKPGELDLAFLDRNPPDHGRLRRLATPAFRPALLRGYRDRIATAVDDLLTPVVPGEPFDLIRTLATPVPVGVICTLLGLDGADVATLARYGQVVAIALSGRELSASESAELEDAKQALAVMFERVARERAADPRDDVITHLVQAMPDRITAYELLVTTRLLLIAGFETTVNLIGNAVMVLLQHPEAWKALTGDPDGLAPRVVGESLRHDPPVHNTGRFIAAELTVGSTTIPKGSWVTTLIGSANRDDAAFADPDRFDPYRENAEDHLSFSGGIHYCLGAPLARLEAEVALAGLARRWPSLRLADSPPKWRASTTIRGLASLPVVA